MPINPAMLQSMGLSAFAQGGYGGIMQAPQPGGFWNQARSPTPSPYSPELQQGLDMHPTPFAGRNPHLDTWFAQHPALKAEYDRIAQQQMPQQGQMPPYGMPWGQSPPYAPYGMGGPQPAGMNDTQQRHQQWLQQRGGMMGLGQFAGGLGGFGAALGSAFPGIRR